MNTKSVQKEIFSQMSEFEFLKNKSFTPRKIDEKAEEYISSPLIKVVLGPRRSGKSTFCVNALKNKKDVAYVNFDNQTIMKATHTEINQALSHVYPDAKYFFFDELQNLNDWEVLVSGLHRNGKNILVTGSNSKLLSRELATALTGRHVPIYILPFEYEEFLKAKSLKRNTNSLTQYIENGGFPELIFNTIPNYLNTLIDSLILKDVVDRYKVRNISDLQNLADYLFLVPATPQTVNSLQKTLKIKSLATVSKFLSYLEEVFIFIKLDRFSQKEKQRITSYKKFYPIDTGYLSAKKISINADDGKKLETFIALELYKKSKKENSSLFYYRTKNTKEVDFVLVKNRKVLECVQVSENLNHQNYKREISALVEAGQELACSTLIVYANDWTEEAFLYAEEKGVKILNSFDIA